MSTALSTMEWYIAAREGVWAGMQNYNAARLTSDIMARYSKTAEEHHKGFPADVPRCLKGRLDLACRPGALPDSGWSGTLLHGRRACYNTAAHGDLMTRRSLWILQKAVMRAYLQTCYTAWKKGDLILQYLNTTEDSCKSIGTLRGLGCRARTLHIDFVEPSFSTAPPTSGIVVQSSNTVSLAVSPCHCYSNRQGHMRSVLGIKPGQGCLRRPGMRRLPQPPLGSVATLTFLASRIPHPYKPSPYGVTRCFSKSISRPLPVKILTIEFEAHSQHQPPSSEIIHLTQNFPNLSIISLVESISPLFSIPVSFAHANLFELHLTKVILSYKEMALFLPGVPRLRRLGLDHTLPFTSTLPEACFEEFAFPSLKYVYIGGKP
ncbi:hypothetical protein BKA70DRAFT_1482694 [Coprinopsis sp. MPI-PUGE-AT-0042]|nr:hypothetical protein BKA70DRAFT_1482694 [Coprinopsis sp. MPI-PUGE-AT-0042]